MTSVLLVDTIKNSLDSSSNVAITGGIIAPGTIVQTQHATTNSRTSVAGTTFTSLLSVNITPKSSSSKILVSCMFNGASTDRYAAIKLFRTVGGTSTQIASNGDVSGNRTPVWFEVFGNHAVWTTDGWQYQTFNHNGVFYDSPSTTSQITYAIHGGNTTNSGTLWMNRMTYGDTDAAWNHYPQTSLTAQEIAQ